MNINLKLRISVLLLIVVAGITSQQLKAQVTVGSNVPPVQAAILDIKTQAPDVNNVTSTKGGLGLPRVKLVNKTKLEPFITSQTPTQEIQHAGLMVYNLYESAPGETNLDLKFKPGVYVWDGAKWSQVGEGVGQRYFYIPSFNIKIDEVRTTGAKFEINLYDEYKRQFTKAGNPTFVSSNTSMTRVPSPEDDRIYTETELDFVVTYYDTNILDEVEVGSDGVMKYYVKSLDTTPSSFLNVVFVVQ